MRPYSDARFWDWQQNDIILTSWASTRRQSDVRSTHMMSIWCCFDSGCTPQLFLTTSLSSFHHLKSPGDLSMTSYCRKWKKWWILRNFCSTTNQPLSSTKVAVKCSKMAVEKNAKFCGKLRKMLDIYQDIYSNISWNENNSAEFHECAKRFHVWNTFACLSEDSREESKTCRGCSLPRQCSSSSTCKKNT